MRKRRNPSGYEFVGMVLLLVGQVLLVVVHASQDRALLALVSAALATVAAFLAVQTWRLADGQLRFGSFQPNWLTPLLSLAIMVGVIMLIEALT
jgi:hypothetical protein